MTERIYYTDAYTTNFSSRVTAVMTLAGRPALELERTAFYPASGGQPCDTGTLAGQEVVEVLVDEAGRLLHVLAAAPAAIGDIVVGDIVTGEVTWAHRFDHMQQHSGQHLLSHCFTEQFGWETVSVHIGADECTLDLETATAEPAQLDAVEALANAMAYQALPIRIYFVEAEKLAQVPLRRAPKVTGTVRIVEIERADYSACGGTHVRTTAELAPIKILRAEKRRGQLRITFVCGLRAVADHVRKHRLLLETARLFSTDPAAVPGNVQRLLDQQRELQRRFGQLEKAWVEAEAPALWAAAPAVAGSKVVALVLPGRSAEAVKQMATLLAQRAQTVALLAGDDGGKCTVVTEQFRLNQG
jgi:alanyl-tRNA synthetase